LSPPSTTFKLRPPKRHLRLAHLTCVVAVTLLESASAWADPSADSSDSSDVSVTPYRPTVSTPAQLSAAGWLEGEFGGLDTAGPGPERMASIPYAIKLAFTPDWGIRISGNAYQSGTTDDRATSRGLGDTSLILKRRFAIDDASAFGLEFSALAPTAPAAIGNGRPAYGTTGIYSIDFGGGYHSDVNLFLTRLGGFSAVSPWQTGYAVALSHPISNAWGLFGEFSGFHQRGLPDTDQYLTGATYNVSKSLVIDVGAEAGLTAASPRWGVFSGFTVLLDRLF
jgi:hypothetical protein